MLLNDVNQGVRVGLPSPYDPPSPSKEWHDGQVTETLIAEFKSKIDGELIDRGRVTDQLLDLRLTCDHPGFITLVDEMLRDLPGRSVVETSWWSDALDRLAAQATALPA